MELARTGARREGVDQKVIDAVKFNHARTGFPKKALW